MAVIVSYWRNTSPTWNMVSISTALEFIWLELLMSLWNVIQIQGMGSSDKGELRRPLKLFVVWRILSFM